MLVVAPSIRVTSSRLSTVGKARGCFTRCSLRVRSGRSSVRVKKNRNADTAVFIAGTPKPVSLCSIW